MKRLTAFTLCLLIALAMPIKAANPKTANPVFLSLQDAMARVGKVYAIDCGLQIPGKAVLDFYDSLDNPSYWTTIADLTQMPLNVPVYTGGPAVVYIRIVCTSADGSVPPTTATWRFHYPDAPAQVAPAAPTGISVSP